MIRRLGELLILVGAVIGLATAAAIPPAAVASFIIMPVGAPELAAPTSAIAKPWEAAVRLKVDNGDGSASLGSGTVILSRSGESVILTCAHIFHDAANAGASSRPIQVDLFDGILKGPRRNQVTFRESLAGRCLDFDRGLDVGLVVVITPGKALPATPPVEKGWLPAIGEALVSVGCSKGADATACTTRVLRFTQGVTSETGPNEAYRGIECDFPPQQGRSGGGLHRSDGRIAGVCDFNTADQGTGLYAAPASVHAILERNGLGWLVSPAKRAEPKPPGPNFPEAPEPSPGDVKPPPSARAAAGFDLYDPLHWFAAAAGVWFTVTKGAGVVRRFRLRPGSDPADALQALLDRLHEQEAATTKAKDDESLLQEIRELVRNRKPAAPVPEPAAPKE